MVCGRRALVIYCCVGKFNKEQKMRLSLVAIIILSFGLMACTNSETAPVAEQAEQRQPLLEQTLVKKNVFKKKRCQFSPPVFDKKKILNMLIRSGDIDASDTPEQKSQQVINYINQKQQALVNKCHK